MKKYILLLILLFSLATPASAFAGGDGSVDDPYKISNIYELQAINDDLDAHYVLINDIDASETREWNEGTGFEPVGEYETNPFTGTFDGQNHTIAGLHIERPEGIMGTGLFDYTQDAVIENIRLVDVLVNYFDGAAALVNYNNGTIDNVYLSGRILGYHSAGGFVYTNYGTISNSCADVTVSTQDYAAGFVKENKGTIANCYITGRVTPGHSSDGFVSSNSGIITNSYSTIYITNGYELSSCSFVGGNSGTITNSYWNTDVTTLPSAGGEGRTTDEMTFPYAKNTYLLRGYL